MSDRDVAAISETIHSAKSEDGGVRHNTWIAQMRNGAFSFGALSDSEAADLVYVPKGVGSWKAAALGTTKSEDSADDVFEHNSAFESSDWKRFHDALKAHREFILNALLPEYRLPSSYEEFSRLAV